MYFGLDAGEESALLYDGGLDSMGLLSRDRSASKIISSLDGGDGGLISDVVMSAPIEIAFLPMDFSFARLEKIN